MSREKRNIKLLISLVALSLASLSLFLFSTEQKEEINPAMFRLADSKVINKVVFQRDSAKVELEFVNNGWQVNQTFEADRNLVDVLFATMAQAVPKRAAASKIRDSVAHETRQHGVKTDFYRGQTLEKTIWVWGDEAQGVTYFVDNESDTPYLMNIPGYRVFVGGIFVQPVGMWRDKRIFNFNWRNFSELSASFPNDPKQDFKVTMVERFFSIEGMPNVDTTTLNNYLDAVSLISADNFYIMGESARYDSLSKTKPIMWIQVKDISNKQLSLDVFAVGRDDRSVLARWGSDYVWFDRRNIVQLYKKRKDFIKQTP